MLFEADARGMDPLRALAAKEERAEAPLNPYAGELVRGVVAHQERIDLLLAEHSEGWTLDRMPAVDRSLLRLGAYEVLYGAGVPGPVAVSEAVALAQDLSTDESPGFVNGLLGRLLERRDALLARDAEQDALDAAEQADEQQHADAQEPGTP